MSSIAAPPLTVVQPGAGAHGTLGTIGVVFKLWGHDTGGALSIVDHPFPAGALVPPHTHTREGEYSIVAEGQIGFRSGDREVVLGPGGYITKPRGERHTMWNAGPVPARMIEIISPAGFEHFFRELADLTADGPPEPPRHSGPGRPVRPAIRPAGLAARADRAVPPHPAARRLSAPITSGTGQRILDTPHGQRPCRPGPWRHHRRGRATGRPARTGSARAGDGHEGPAAGDLV